MKIKYVLSDGHSGSTFLQFLLAKQPNTIGLGEIYNTLVKKDEEIARVCSCRKRENECDFWAELYSKKNESEVEYYQAIIKKAKSILNNCDTIVDSSKSINGLKVWLKLKELGFIDSIEIFYLFRDPRAWVFSTIRKSRLKKKGPTSRVKLFYNWYKNQNVFLAFLKTEKLLTNTQIISYDRLVLDGTNTKNEVVLELHKRLVKKTGHFVHDMHGNRMKYDFDKESAVKYDFNWFYDYKILGLSLLIWPVWKLVQKLGREHDNQS